MYTLGFSSAPKFGIVVTHHNPISKLNHESWFEVVIILKIYYSFSDVKLVLVYLERLWANFSLLLKQHMVEEQLAAQRKGCLWGWDKCEIFNPKKHWPFFKNF